MKAIARVGSGRRRGDGVARIVREKADAPALRRGRRGSRSIRRILSLGGHLSRRPVARPLEPPTRDLASSLIVPVWRCTAWGLPSRRRYRRRWCALTAPFHPYPTKVGRSVFCGALPSGFPAQALPGTLLCGVRTFLPVSEETRRPPDLRSGLYRLSRNGLAATVRSRHGTRDSADWARWFGQDDHAA